MSKELVAKAGAWEQDNLVAHITPPPATTGITLAAGTGELRRGAVLARNSDGDYVPYKGDSGTEPSMVLAEGAALSSGETSPAVGYRAGCFRRDALVFGTDDYTPTAGDVDALRKFGIILSDSAD